MKHTQDSILSVFRSFFEAIKDVIICFLDLLTFSLACQKVMKTVSVTFILKQDNFDSRKNQIEIRVTIDFILSRRKLCK